jgi:4-hydroxy-tetrahydrodipicolinate reductase
MKIAVCGATGRIGRVLIKHLLHHPQLKLVGCGASPGSKELGADIGRLIGIEDAGISICADLGALFERSDIVIDFSTPEATTACADLARTRGVPLVTGTSGLDGKQQEIVRRAAERVAVLQSPNFSLGANLVLAATTLLASALDDDYDIEVLCKTHRNKADAPSGTAFALAQSAARARKVDLQQNLEQFRHGRVGPRPRGAIGIATMRGGGGPSEHLVLFAGLHDEVQIKHTLYSPDLLIQGAIRAALWMNGRDPGLYSMLDVLGFGN